MPKRECLGRCGALIDSRQGSRCPSCQARMRGTTSERNYGADHQRLRAEWQKILDAGEIVICWRCRRKGKPHPVDPSPDRWDLGHDDDDRTIIRGPECRAGNRGAPGLRGPRGRR